jgi:hypothetical protein
MRNLADAVRLVSRHADEVEWHRLAGRGEHVGAKPTPPARQVVHDHQAALELARVSLARVEHSRARLRASASGRCPT